MINKLKTAFASEFGSAPTLIVRAPGRINLIGEHTDYNMGLVFPAAIDKSMYFAFKPNGTNHCKLIAKDKEDTENIDLDAMGTDKLWAKYCIGVLQEFQKLGKAIKGFDCLFMSDIPIGAGVSSSAALECGFAKGIDTMLGSGLSQWELARVGNRAENNYLRIQSGILDQFSSLFGQEGKAMLMNCETQTFEYHNVNIAPYELVLINTNVKHSHLSSGYNDRPSECKEVLRIAKEKYPELENLSQMSSEQLQEIKPLLSTVLYNRAQFILEENARVMAFKAALLEKDYEALGALLYASHDGLQNMYEVSCSELDLLISLTQNQPSIKGARMMGGGFGGCTLNLIHSDNKETVIREICDTYKEKTSIKASPYFIKIANGVEIIES